MKKLLLIALMFGSQASLAGEFKGKLICLTSAMTQKEVGVLEGLTPVKVTGDVTQRMGPFGHEIVIDLERVSRADKTARPPIRAEYKVEGVKGLVILNIGFYYRGEVKQGNLAGIRMSLGNGKRDKDGIMKFRNFAETSSPLMDNQSYNLEIFPGKGQLLKTEVECFLDND